MTEPRPRSLWSGRSIVCFSTADWDTLLPTNKHHLMRRLAKRGARVLFIETLGTRAPSLGSGRDVRRIARRLGRVVQGAVPRERRLATLSPLVQPAWGKEAVRRVNRASFGLQVRPVLKKLPRRIAWVYSPYAIHLLDLVEPLEAVVYHMVDDLAAVPGADVAALRAAEEALLRRADVVFCTERSLLERAQAMAAEKAHLMPNVADAAHFANSGDREPLGLDRVRALPRPRLVFSGHLAPHKVDLQLLDSLAAERPQWQFVLIGPEWEGYQGRRHPALERLSTRKNVRLLGHVPYEELPPFLHEADALLIPYAQNDATRAVFPMKLYEYLAVGAPVVATPLPSLVELNTDLVRLATSPTEWIAAVEEALAEGRARAEERRRMAGQQTWETRLGEMEGVIAQALRLDLAAPAIGRVE